MTTGLDSLKALYETILAAGMYSHPSPLRVSVFQCPDRRVRAAVLHEKFTPVEPGFRWGPKWSTAWFKIQGHVPASMRGQRVALRFSTGTEGMLWNGDTPVQGFDQNRDAAVLFESAADGELVDVLVEAACNHPLGVGWFFWDKPEVAERWSQGKPGLLERCELAVMDERAWRVRWTAQFLVQLAEQLPEGSPRREMLIREVGSALSGGADPAEALARLQSLVPGEQPISKTRCLAVGHAHLDTAWMWPIAETRRKAVRTFSNALRLMERFPQFTFLCSQPQQYEWIELETPGLFEQIRQRVAEGRWEPMGAMWIEPDGNLPSGESFIRQIIHGTRYWERVFGDKGRQRLAYLPDTFGFAPSLPQILRLSGLDTFITNKLWWNETNEFPYLYFRWRGIDGTEIVSHLTPGQEYNATNTPFELRRGQTIAERKDDLGVGVWLQPFGFGDGGGGPTDWNILNAQLAGQCEGIPNTELSGAARFCDQLHGRRKAIRGTGADFPVYEGELYLERHRGTYTTQARVKRDNALAEASLRIAEWLLSCSPSRREEPGGWVGSTSNTQRPVGTQSDPSGKLHQAWKLTLLNQFHDILPGSSITEVYHDAARDHAAVLKSCCELEGEGAAAWCGAIDTRGMQQPVAVFNPASHVRSQWIEWSEAGQTRGTYVADVPAMGVRVIDAARLNDAKPPVTVAGNSITNGIIEARIDGLGRVSSLRRVGGEDVVGRDDPGNPTPINQLVLYDDHPKYWEAWDIDAEALLHPKPVESAATVQTVTLGADRPAIRVDRSLGKASRITQTYTLRPGSPRLDVETWVDWHEERQFLRALFPTAIRSDVATFEVPFGHIQRPTTDDTPINKARFEVPAHRWMDLSQPGRGLAVLNDGKYGHCCRAGVMGLSLLRSTKWPDPTADMGEHRFTYSLMPHAGDWRGRRVLIARQN